VKVEGVGELDLVGPTGVAVADPEVVEPPAPPAEEVPLVGGAEDPVPVEMVEERVLEVIMTVDKVIEGQYVVVYVEVYVVEPVVQIVVTVAVVVVYVVVAPPIPDAEEVVEVVEAVDVGGTLEVVGGALVEVLEAEEDEEVEIGVQSGRVKVVPLDW
jgi:hypothetical protein